MNQPTKEQVEGMVMMSIYLYGSIYEELIRIEMYEQENHYGIAAYYDDGDWTFQDVLLPKPFDIKSLEQACNHLIEKLEPIIQARTNQQS